MMSLLYRHLLLLFLAVASAASMHFALREPTRAFLSVQVYSAQKGTLQVFFNLGQGWNEDHSTSAHYGSNGSQSSVLLALPQEKVLGLRLDPSGMTNHSLTIESVRVVDQWKRNLLSIPIQSLAPLAYIEWIEFGKNGLSILTSPDLGDSQLLVKIEQPIDVPSLRPLSTPLHTQAIHALLEILAFYFLWLLVYTAIRWLLLLFKMIRSEGSPIREASPHATSRLSRLLLLLFGVIVGVNGFLFAHYFTGYFFLLDDFWVLHIAANHSFSDLFTKAHIGFYRPLVFVLFKLQMYAFGWEHPEMHSLVCTMLHLGNAVLAGLFIYRLWHHTQTAFFGGVVFLVAPWFGETPLWLCLQSDLAAVSGTLIVLLLGIEIERDQKLSAIWLRCLLLFLASLFSYLAKESSLPLPAILGLFFLFRTSIPDLLRNSIAYLHLLAVSLALVAYILLRSHYLSALGGAYGDYFDLLKNMWVGTLLYPFHHPPLEIAGQTDGPLLGLVYRILFFLLLLISFIKTLRSAILLATAFSLALLPILPFQIPFGSGAGTRWLYLPGLFVTLLLSLGFKGFLSPIRKVKDKVRISMQEALLFSGTLLFLGIMTIFSQNQRDNWNRACRISQSCMEQFAGVKDRADYFRIPNLPHQFREGAVIVASHNFTAFFPEKTIRVRGELNLLQDNPGFIERYQSIHDGWSGHSGHPGEYLFYIDYGALEQGLDE